VAESGNSYVGNLGVSQEGPKDRLTWLIQCISRRSDGVHKIYSELSKPCATRLFLQITLCELQLNPTIKAPETPSQDLFKCTAQDAQHQQHKHSFVASYRAEFGLNMRENSGHLGCLLHQLKLG